MNNRAQIQKPKNGPLSSGYLFELGLYSTFIFVFSALFVQFLLIIQTSILLRLYSYPIQSSLFTIFYLSTSNKGWSDAQVYIVFGTGPLILSGVGLWLLEVLKRIEGVSWKTRLVLTWMAFLMVNALPCGFVAGTFFIDSFGVAFQWINSSFLIRGMISIAVLIFMAAFNDFWLMLFLRTADDPEFIKKGETRRIFIKNVVYKPLIFGFFILLFFNWPFRNLYWPAFLFGIWYLIIPTSDRLHRSGIFHIRASEMEIFDSRLQKLLFFLLLVFIWALNYFIIY